MIEYEAVTKAGEAPFDADWLYMYAQANLPDGRALRLHTRVGRVADAPADEAIRAALADPSFRARLRFELLLLEADAEMKARDALGQ